MIPCDIEKVKKFQKLLNDYCGKHGMPKYSYEGAERAYISYANNKAWGWAEQMEIKSFEDLVIKPGWYERD